MDVRLGVIVDAAGAVAGSRAARKAITGISKATSLATGGLRSLGNTLFSLKGLIAGVGLGVLTKSFLDVGTTVENLQVRLKVLLGSVQEGNKLFDDMSKFASTVPFELENIINSSARLATVLKGGRTEISTTIPAVADLAAAFGLTLEQTSDQIARAFSAGAGAADLFRDRGVNAMLGFQAGAKVTGEQFKKRFFEAFNDVNSKFRGAANDLAKTWTGTMSMLADKWFQFRKIILDAGVFNYIKAIARLIDTQFGVALDDSKNRAKKWSDTIISGLETIIRAFFQLSDVLKGTLVFINSIYLAWQGIVGVFRIGYDIILRVGLAMEKLKNTQSQSKEVIADYNKKIMENQNVLLDSEKTFDTTVKNILDNWEKMGSGAEQGRRAISAIRTEYERLQEISTTAPGGTPQKDAAKKAAEDAAKKAAEDQMALSTAMDSYGKTLRDASIEESYFFDKQETLDTLFQQNLITAQVYKNAMDELNQSFLEGAATTDVRSEAEQRLYDRQTAILESGVERITQSLMTEEERLTDSYDRRLFILEDAFQRELLSYETRNSLVEKLEAQHQKNLALEKQKGYTIAGKFGDAYRKGDLRGIAKYGAQATSAAASNNRAMFEANKAFALADATIGTYDSVVQSYKNAGGYPWGLIPAGLMLAAGLANINAIASTQYGGKGSASASAVGGGGGGAGAPINTIPSLPTADVPQQETTGREVRIEFTGDVYGWDDYVQNKVVDGIRSAIDDQDVILISNESRQAQEFA